MKTLLKAVLLIALLSAQSLIAGVIFDNGIPNSVNGNELTIYIQTEDFSLTAARSLTDVRFWALDTAGRGAYLGSIAWFIYADSAGNPGSILFSGTATPVVTNYPAARCCGLTEGLQLDFSVGAITLSGGTTYHLGLHNGPLTATNGLFFWATTAGNTSPTGLELRAPFAGDDWFNNGNEHAFQLFGNPVPEPATFGLLGGGLVLVIGLARRRPR